MIIIVMTSLLKKDEEKKKHCSLVTLTRLHLVHHTHSLGTLLHSPRPSSTRHISATTPTIVRIWILIVLWKRARAGDLFMRCLRSLGCWWRWIFLLPVIRRLVLWRARWKRFVRWLLFFLSFRFYFLWCHGHWIIQWSNLFMQGNMCIEKVWNW